MASELVRFRPPRIAFALVAIAAVLHVVLPAALARFTPLPWPGGGIGLAGFGIMMTAWWQFRRHAVAICPTAPTSRLLTGGVYRLSRNPMYLGMSMMLLALALWMGSASLLLAAAGFVAIMQRVFCPYEEDRLREAFPADFAAYAARVRRWL